MTSKAYQLSSSNYTKIEDVKTDKYVFTGPVIRRMSAEQFSDAVSQVIAPVYYAVAYEPISSGLPSSRIWHRERKYDRDVLPEPGKRFFRYKVKLHDKEIKMAKALISVDHSYSLYVNDQLVSQGSEWRKVDKVNLSKILIKGDNIIAVEGENEGSIPNPAGILFSLKIQYEDGEEVMVNSGKDWRSTDDEPANGWTSLTFDDVEWQKAKSYGSRHWDKLVNYSFEESRNEFARASLVRQHPFMKALGRPSRENVATTRDEQATLLQALELTNGDFFNKVLEKGAVTWLEKHDNSAEIADFLYQKLFGRSPDREEKNTMLRILGDTPNEENVQDLFWAALLLPEFQFIF